MLRPTLLALRTRWDYWFIASWSHLRWKHVDRFLIRKLRQQNLAFRSIKWYASIWIIQHQGIQLPDIFVELSDWWIRLPGPATWPEMFHRFVLAYDPLCFRSSNQCDLACNEMGFRKRLGFCRKQWNATETVIQLLIHLFFREFLYESLAKLSVLRMCVCPPVLEWLLWRIHRGNWTKTKRSSSHLRRNQWISVAEVSIAFLDILGTRICVEHCWTLLNIVEHDWRVI